MGAEFPSGGGSGGTSLATPTHSIEEFGAVAGTDMTTAMTTAMATLKNGDVLLIPSRHSLVDGTVKHWLLGASGGGITVPDGVEITGGGRNASVVECNYAGTTRVKMLAPAGYTRLTNLGFVMGSGIDRTAIPQVIFGQAGAYRIELQAVDFIGGFGMCVDTWQDVTTDVLMRDVLIDGQLAGLATGANRQVVMGIAHNGAGRFMLDNVEFRGLGSNAADKPYSSHCIYIAPNTTLLATKCRFRNHLQGRLVQFYNGFQVTPPAPIGPDVIRDCEFGAYNGASGALPYSACETSEVKETSYVDCHWAAQATVNGGSLVNVKASARFPGCRFDGASSTPSAYLGNPDGFPLSNYDAAGAYFNDVKYAGALSGTVGGDLAGTLPNPTIATGAVTSAKIADGTIVDGDIAAGAAITPSKISGTAVVTGDSRLSDQRTPIDASVTDAKIATTLSPSKVTGTAVVTADSRLSDARTPTAHASSHTSAGSDPVTIAESQVTNLTTDLAAKAPLASPAFSGTPTAPTQTAGNNSTRLATTAYADGAVSTEASARSAADALKAPLVSPALTGSPTAPTQAALDNSTKLATTGYADAAVSVEAGARATAISGRQPLDADLTALAALTPSVAAGALIWNGSAWTNATIADANVAAGAAIAESKLSLASDAAAGTPSRRSLGYSGTQAAPGSDAARDAQPRHHGLLAWAFDPLLAFTTFVGVNGQVLLVKIMVPQTLSVTNVEVIVAIKNTTPTAGQNFAAIFDSTGAPLGITADMSTLWNTPSNGSTKCPISGGPVSVPGGTDVFVWAAFLQQAATPFTYGSYSNANAAIQTAMNLTAAQSRFATSGSGQIAMPGSITPGTLTQSNRSPWAGLS